MQQDRIALAVQTHCHSTDRAMDDIALESDALALEVSHEAIKVFDLERDLPPAVSLGVSLVKLVRATQPPPGRSYSTHQLSPWVADRARLEAKRLLVELACPRDVGDR
jgi:hypothetical protein